MKANSNNPTGWDPRKSLIILKSLIHPQPRFPKVDEDGDEEMEIDEEAVEKLCIQVGLPPVSTEDHDAVDESRSIIEQGPEDTDVDMEEGICEQIERHEIMTVDCNRTVTNTTGFSGVNVHICNDMMEVNDKEGQVHLPVHTLDADSCGKPSEVKRALSSSLSELQTEESQSKMGGVGSSCPASDSQSGISTGILVAGEPNDSQNDSVNCVSASTLSIVPCEVSPVLKSPTPSVSPRINSSRKSLRTSSMLTASQKDSKDESKSGPEDVRLSFAKSMKSNLSNALAAQTSKSSLIPTEHLAASLYRGLEIIDSHRKSSAFRRSSFRFSYKHAEYKPVMLAEKVDVGVQTFLQDDEITEEDPTVLLCENCKIKLHPEVKDADDSSNLQLVPVDGSECIDKSKKQVPKVSLISSAQSSVLSMVLTFLFICSRYLTFYFVNTQAVEKVLAGAIRREMALEEFCAKQSSEIMQLNRLVSC